MAGPDNSRDKLAGWWCMLSWLSVL